MYFSALKKNTWILLCNGLFWLVALVNIWALNNHNTQVDLITKPLLLPLLFFYYLSYKRKDSAYILILFISWIGSLFFIGEIPETTIAGIICFWASLLLYTYTVIQYLEIPFYKNLSQPKKVIPLLIYAVYFVSIMTLLGPNLNDWLITIAAYALTVTFLSYIATIYYLEQPKNKFRLYFLIGILLLFLDASIICYQLFNQDNTIISLSVRIIFILAQYLICIYFIFDHRPKQIT